MSVTSLNNFNSQKITKSLNEVRLKTDKLNSSICGQEVYSNLGEMAKDGKLFKYLDETNKIYTLHTLDERNKNIMNLAEKVHQFYDQTLDRLLSLKEYIITAHGPGNERMLDVKGFAGMTLKEITSSMDAISTAFGIADNIVNPSSLPDNNNINANYIKNEPNKNPIITAPEGTEVDITCNLASIGFQKTMASCQLVQSNGMNDYQNSIKILDEAYTALNQERAIYNSQIHKLNLSLERVDNKLLQEQSLHASEFKLLDTDGFAKVISEQNQLKLCGHMLVNILAQQSQEQTRILNTIFSQIPG